MNLYKRGNTYWVTASGPWGRLRASTGTHLKGPAGKRALELLRDAQQHRQVWSLGKAVRQTRSTRWEGAKNESGAVANAEAAIEHFGKSMHVDSINTFAMDGWVAALKLAGNGPATINRKLAALSAVLRTAHERGALAAMPKVPRMREPEGRLRWLTEVEERQLLAELYRWDKHEEHALTVFLLGTGLRLGEALTLTWRDVSDERVIHVWDGKTGHRSVPGNLRVTNAVHQQWAYRPAAAADRVWTLDRRKYQRVLAAAMRVVRIEDASVHTLRHTFASKLVQKGVNISVIQRLLGHKSVTTTMRYAHISADNLRDAVETLEDRAAPTLRRVK